MIAVTVLGSVDGEPVRRSGARPGDVVAIAGRQGWAAGGLAVLARGFRSPRVLVEAHRRPEPPYAAGPEPPRLGATAMIDVSDGLLADVGHIAEASGVAIDICDADAFEVAEPLQRGRRRARGRPDAVHPRPAGTTTPWWRRSRPARRCPTAGPVIGEVARGEGVTVDGAAYEGPAGHTHF